MKLEEILRWGHAKLFSNWINALTTLVILYLAWQLIPALIDWALVNAIWSPQNANDCRDAARQGACWAFVADKYRFILFGTFPVDQQWRPAIVILLLLALYALSAWRTFTRPRLIAVWVTGLGTIGWLMWGGLLGLSYVENERWGGLTLTLLAQHIRHRLRFSTVDLAGAWTALRVTLGPLVLHRLHRADSRRAVDFGSVHGVGHAAIVSAGGSFHRQAAARPARHDSVRRGLSGRGRARRLASDPAPTGRSRARPRPRLLAAHLVHHPAPSAAYRDPPFGQYVYRFLQGYLPGGHHRPIRFSDGHQSIAQRAPWTGFGVEAYLFAALGYFLFCYPMSRYSQRLERNVAPGRRISAAGEF